jgi:hypothetical protein
MAKKEENPPFYAIRVGGVLKPEFQADLTALERFPQGQRIKVTLSTGRSPSRLRWYWSFLHKVRDATDCTPNVESLHELIKLETGYSTPVKIKGYTVLVPKSIAFGSMSEEDFSKFCFLAEEFIAKSFGLTAEDVFKGE